MICLFFKKAVVTALVLASSAPAFAEGEASAMDKMFAAVNFSSVVTFVASAGVTIVGIALAGRVSPWPSASSARLNDCHLCLCRLYVIGDDDRRIIGNGFCYWHKGA